MEKQNAIGNGSGNAAGIKRETLLHDVTKRFNRKTNERRRTITKYRERGKYW